MNRLKKLFSDYIRGKSSNEEKNIVDLWYTEKGKLASITEEDAKDFVSKAWSDFLKYQERQKRKSKLATLYLSGGIAIASVLLVLIVLQMPINKEGSNSRDIIRQSQVSKQFVADQNMKKITLADGSVVYLNKGTTLSLHKGKFNAYMREVWLDEGEAFFEVAKDSHRPFIVHTRDGLSTRVLGTSFNIKAYRELGSQVISVKTGLVQVNTTKGKSVLLEKNNKTTFNYSDGKLVSSLVNGKDAAEWRNGRVFLDHVPVNELVFRLKQYYQVNVVNNAIAEDMEVYTSFTLDTPLEHVIANIASIFDVSYRIEGKMVYFD